MTTNSHVSAWTGKQAKSYYNVNAPFGPAPNTAKQDLLQNGHSQQAHENDPPTLVHKLKSRKSVLALAVSNSRIYAGTQAGEILVWSLENYEQLASIRAHRWSVLSLFIPHDGKLLFSSAGDAIVNVWCTEKLCRLYSIYSTYDVGDVFCVAYSTILQTVYLGAQNTSIQWYDLSQRDTRSPPNLATHPSQRSHRFFDSKGPGGLSTPRPDDGDTRVKGGQLLEIDKAHILQYSHYGYVYCMLLAETLVTQETDGEILISGGGDGTIKLWQLSEKEGEAIQLFACLESGDDSVLSLALDGTILYSGRLGGEINIWDLDTRQQIRRLTAHQADVLTLAVGQGAFFSGAATGFAKKFNKRYECVSRWKVHDELILASTVATYNDKAIYVTGGNDDCVAIWALGSIVKQSVDTAKTSNDQLVESLGKLVAYRTVSSQSEYAGDCRRGASWLRNTFKRFGATTEIFTTEENMNPVVFARFKGRASSGKTEKQILFYGHYDVIAADDDDQNWRSDPFEMHGINGYLYGRGVSDNKGPVMAAIYAVADLVAEQKLESDIVFLIEGEEECGSRGFEGAIKRNKHLIGEINWILVANSYWLTDDYPCLTYGLRGVIHATVQIESQRPDLHSGVDGSHLLDEALKDLVMLLAQMTGTNGTIKIPGFYEPVLPISEAENTRYEAISNTLLHQTPSMGDAESLTESLKGRWREPSLTIHGFKTSGSNNSTIIPYIASAGLSMRLVPNQNTEEVHRALIDYLDDQFALLKSSNKLTINIHRKAEPWLGDPENEIFQTLEEAVVEAWNTSNNAHSPNGTRTAMENSSFSLKPSRSARSSQPSITKVHSGKPLYIREGGSIPAIRFLEQEFSAPAAQLPCGQASDNAHLDNERIRLSNLYKSREIFKKVFRELPLK